MEQEPSTKSYGMDTGRQVTSWPSPILLTPEKRWQDYQAGIGSISMGGQGWQLLCLLGPAAEMTQLKAVPQLSSPCPMWGKQAESPQLIMLVVLTASSMPGGFCSSAAVPVGLCVGDSLCIRLSPLPCWEHGGLLPFVFWLLSLRTSPAAKAAVF